MMKRSFVLGAVLTCVLAGSAMATDVPTKAPPIPRPPVPRMINDWTGFYVGVHGGYGWARPRITDFDLNESNINTFDGDIPFGAPKLKGAVFGGHAGYNWQWGQRGVVGLEIDYSAANIRSTQAGSVDFFRECCGRIIETRTLNAKLDSLASARARVGYLVSPEFLLYGTGGAAWGHTKFTGTFLREPSEGDDILDISRASSNHFGWVAGAGAEWMLWNSGLILRVEYLHYDFGSASLAFDDTRTDGATSKRDSFVMPLGRLTTDVVRGGISYKF
jgi:outer membrane immunogenic protein